MSTNDYLIKIKSQDRLIFDTISTLKLLYDDCGKHCTNEDILSWSRSIFDRFRDRISKPEEQNKHSEDCVGNVYDIDNCSCTSNKKDT